MRALARVWAWLMAKSVSLCAALILVICAIVAYEVIARFVFDAPTTWSQEITVYLLLACGFIGIAPTMRAGKHIRVDLLVKRLPAVAQQGIDLAVNLFVAAFAAVAGWGGYQAVAQSLQFGRRSVTLLAVPMWIPQLVLPLGMLLLLIVAALGAWRSFRALRKPGR